MIATISIAFDSQKVLKHIQHTKKSILSSTKHAVTFLLSDFVIRKLKQKLFTHSLQFYFLLPTLSKHLSFHDILFTSFSNKKYWNIVLNEIEYLVSTLNVVIYNLIRVQLVPSNCKIVPEIEFSTFYSYLLWHRLMCIRYISLPKVSSILWFVCMCIVYPFSRKLFIHKTINRLICLVVKIN